MDGAKRSKHQDIVGPNLRRRARKSPLADLVLRLELQRTPGALPFFEQVRLFVRNAVASGVLPVGVRLPPERQLAAALGVSRSTVMHAYQELVADGLVRAAPSRGTTIEPFPHAELEPIKDGASWALGLPSLAPLGADAGLPQDIVGSSQAEEMVSLASSAPPADLIPVSEIAEQLSKAFLERGSRLLGYGPVDGVPELREALAERMSSLGMLAADDKVVVLSGSAQGLALAARVLVEPGDEVVVESPTYLGTIQTFEGAGVRLIGVPVDSAGIRPDTLDAVLGRRRVRLIVLQPNFQNPTGAVLSEPRREQILWLAQRHGVPILEDDAYGSLHYDASAPASLKQLDRNGLVLYLSSFSKTLAPGLRVAWMCGPAPVITRVALAKQYSDLNTNALGQAVVSGFLRSGLYDKHLELVRPKIAARMRMLLAELSHWPELIQAESTPRGGLHIWCRLKVGDSTSAVRAAARVGVAIVGGSAFYPRGSQGVAALEHVRISLPSASEQVISHGIRALADALGQLPPRRAAAGHRATVVV